MNEEEMEELSRRLQHRETTRIEKSKSERQLLAYRACVVILMLVTAYLAYLNQTRGSSSPRSPNEDLYLQTWVLYDEVNDKVPVQKIYLDKVVSLLRTASTKSPEDMHIFLIAHGDNIDDDARNKDVTDSRVWYLDQIIEATLASRDQKLRNWFSKTKRLLWSCGKKMMIEEPLNTKGGEYKNRRVQVIATTNPDLVENEYLEFWQLKSKEPNFNVTDDPRRLSPIATKDRARLDGSIVQNLIKQ